MTWRGDYMATLGILSRRREALGLTQAQLGARIGASRRSVQRYEGGESDPDAATLFRWVAALGVRLEAVGP